jgi:hypothetical protein
MSAIATAVVSSAIIGASASKSAGEAQAGAMDRSAELQMQMFRETQAAQEPWRQAGLGALNKLIPLTEYKDFGMDQFKADPGYAFRLSEGQKALERSAAARGGLLSGGTGKALTRFGQEMGSQEYTNAFNRYQTERSARLAPLQSLAGLGQTTAQQIGQQGMQTGANVGDAIGSGAAARASGYVGTANALNSGLGTYLNYSSNQNLVNTLNRRNPGQTNDYYA